MSRVPHILVGAGGHAAVVLDALQRQGLGLPREIWVEGTPNCDTLLGVPVQPWAAIDLRGQTVHVAVGDGRHRRRMLQALLAQGAAALSVVHPSAQLSAYAQLGAGSFMAAGAVLGPRSETGVGVILNTMAAVDHDCRIGDYAHLAPRATLGGHVEIGAGCWIGIGATIRDRRRVGRDTLVGAGAVVVADLPEQVLAFGVPARVQHRLDDGKPA